MTSPNDTPTDDETVPFDDVMPDVIDTDDGGAIVLMGDEEETDDGEFYANLCDDDGPILDTEATRLGATLLDLIDKDKEARKRRDEQYEEGLKRTGLGDEAPGGASFQGASKVVHPMLTEACVDFAARTMKEIFPPDGPAKMAVPGKYSDDRVAKAQRKASLMNWQLTIQCPEFRAEIAQTMTQVPLGGSQYLKLDWDKPRNRPRSNFVAIDDMLLPYAATNFYSAQRKTHVQYLTQLDYEDRVKDGMYRDVDMAPVGAEPDQTGAGRASDRIEGREQSSYNEDGLRTVYECHVIIDIDGDNKADGPAPYIVTIDKSTSRVLSIYRNWAEDDCTCEELQWFVEWSFIPWRGAYAIGLPQMIGGLSAAATGALRALLDSAHANNALSMLKLKGAKIGGQSQSVAIGSITEIEGGVNVDDIRKVAMPMPFNPPSAVLFQLLGFLVDAGQGVVRTAIEDAADTNPNAPVGTTLARIEQGMVVYSEIHARLHDSMGRALRIIHRLNADNLDDERLEHDVGDELATRADFQGPMDVVPVSDPNIYSEAQRFAQVQAITQRQATAPQLYNARNVEVRLLQTLKVPDYESLLEPAIEPTEQNAVNENVTMTMGKPVTVFPEQDHTAHLQAHLSYLTSPLFGSSDLFAPTLIPGMLNHVRDHMAWWYASRVFDVATQAAGTDIGELVKQMADDKDAAGRKALDRMLAEGGTLAVQHGQQEFESLPQVIAHAHQIMQKFMPGPAADPRIALETQKVQTERERTQTDAQLRTAELQQEAQFKGQELEQKAQQNDLTIHKTELEIELDQQKLGQDGALKHEANQVHAAASASSDQAHVAMNEQDNLTAKQIAAAKIIHDQGTELTDGHGLAPNPNPEQQA